MVPVRIVLAVQDEFYIEAFLHYVNCSEFHQKLRVTAFSKVEAFQKRMMDAAEVPDAVVAEPGYLEFWSPSAGEKRIPRIGLIEGEAELQDDVIALHKYQPLKELITSIMTAVQGQRKPLVTIPTDRARVIGIYSVNGGSGKSTTALQLSRQFSSEGLRVLLLNLETAGSGFARASGRQEHEVSGLGRLLYNLQAAEDKGDTLDLSAANYVIRDPNLQAAMFEPLNNLNELLELTREHTIRLINCLAASGAYDLILVDTDSYPSGCTEGVLERCDQLIWLTTDDIGAVHRTGRWLAHLERTRGEFYSTLVQKSIFTVNRCLGNLANQLPLGSGIPYHTLPYIPAWKQLDSWEELFHSPEYQRDLMKLCGHIMKMSGFHAEASA
ncbi:AAA family ATPase [Paenibacillus sp. YPG26]|uniref:AAA family ATPase n=1 Tax=Paenibacillus sp. YPG26 TaxID=2878915 RepID=UPI00203D0421|nr:AAA family ATPase [Paenibacillus sp. YPG26]USB34105.1 AAA family ATPase [Paenibacillus sp. YPG26]